MNSERRAIALALVQQTALQQAQHTIAELHECTVLANIKEIEGDKLCIRIYNDKISNTIIIARDNIYIKITNDETSSFRYLESTMALFGVHARGQSLRIWDNSNQFNFDMIIDGDDNYRLYTGHTWYTKLGMHVSVINKICKALYAFANHKPVE
jgi:hypothetical protein